MSANEIEIDLSGAIIYSGGSPYAVVNSGSIRVDRRYDTKRIDETTPFTVAYTPSTAKKKEHKR
jgi:hypothetical protein